MANIELRPSPVISRRRIVCLTTVALYGPYTLLFFEAEPSWALVWIWPIFPGLGLSLLTKPYPALEMISGIGGPIVLTAMFLGFALFGTLRFKKMLWANLVVIALASFALVQVVLELLRA